MEFTDDDRQKADFITPSGIRFNPHPLEAMLSANILAASSASLADPAALACLNLQEYLEKYIDGYLFHDLESIATRIPDNLHPGAAGYPMLLTICSGMELLGALVRPTLQERFNEKDGIKYFGHYWRYYLSSVNPEYKKYGNAARTLVRNGLAHLFMTKPKIGVVKHRKGLHLTNVDGHLIFDAVELYEDFKKSYETYAKPRILDGKDGTQLADNRLHQIIAKYTIESDETLQKLLEDAKKADPLSTTDATTLPPVS